MSSLDIESVVRELRQRKYEPEGRSLSRLEIFMYWLTAIVFLIGVFVFSFYFYHFHDSLNIKQAHWGEFGDYVGGILNPIIAFSALLALLVSIGIQSKELAAANELLKQSNTVLKRQSFGAIFFPMLTMHLEFIRQFSYVDCKDGENKEVFLHGNAAFEKHWDVLESCLHSMQDEVEVEGKEFTLSDIQNVVEGYTEVEVAYIDPYISNLTSMLSIIESSGLDDVEDYYSLLTSNFSRQQWSFLFLILTDPFYRATAEVFTKRQLWQWSYLPEVQYNNLIINYYNGLIKMPSQERFRPQ